MSGSTDASYASHELLERILLLQSAIPAAPDERHLFELLLHGLESLPGVRQVAACIEGSVFRPGRTAPEACEGWQGERPEAPCQKQCRRFTGPDFKRATIRTAERWFGHIIFSLDDSPPAVLPQLVSNLANQVAIRIEHDRLQRALRELNRGLEALVRERTADLLAREQELRAALEKLSKQEALLSRLMETSPVSICFVDREGHITFANQRAEQLLGVRQSEIVQRRYNASAWKITSWDGRPFPDEELPFSRVKATRQPVFGVRHAIEWPDGRRVLLSINAAPLFSAAGDFDGMVASFEDATEEVRAQRERSAIEEQLRHSQKMEAIGRLAAGVAHDFNNLLTVVQGYADQMLEELPPADPLREAVLEIRDAGRRTADITRQLLAFSRRQPMRLETVALNDLLRRMQKMLGRLLGEDVELRFDLADNLPSIHIDPSQLEQVIVNLAVNARDAMPDGGRLSIATRPGNPNELPGEARLGQPGGEIVTIEVADTGCGMPHETLQKIFEPFFTTKAKGTGLGLSTVFGIVKQSGGEISVESRQGKGTTFRIFFPALSEEALRQTNPAPPASQTPGRGELILVVEDETPLRNLLSRMLESLGYRVAAAENGGAALLLVEEEKLRPDLLLSDIVMPGMNGWVLAQRLKKTLPALKLVFISGYTEAAISERASLPDDLPFLQKPFDFKQLSVLLREVLARR
ncbi:MAG: response regulator [Myxococcales bacterium]|nr:response regulator [Myxococcales bacterium]